MTQIRRPKDRSLTIAAAPGFLTYWLVPRLAELSAEFPRHDLRLVTGDQGTLPQADVHVRFGDGNWPGMTAIRILDERVFAVSSPALARTMTLEQIAGARLLQLTASPEQRYDWQSWFRALGTTAPPRLNAIDFDDYSLLVSAALAGQGIALCWEGLLSSFLQTGALVRVSTEELWTERGYFATYARQGAAEPVIRLARWLGTRGHSGGKGNVPKT